MPLKDLLEKRPKKRAPDWDDSHLAWAIWYLKENGHVYREFRKLVNNALAVSHRMKISTDQVLHVLRWNTAVAADGDTFEINDHCGSLFTRLYIAEYPHRADRFYTRRSWLDNLTDKEHDELMYAFAPLRHDYNAYA
jgi:hypothetical protein